MQEANLCLLYPMSMRKRKVEKKWLLSDIVHLLHTTLRSVSGPFPYRPGSKICEGKPPGSLHSSVVLKGPSRWAKKAVSGNFFFIFNIRPTA